MTDSLSLEKLTGEYGWNFHESLRYQILGNPQLLSQPMMFTAVIEFPYYFPYPPEI